MGLPDDTDTLTFKAIQTRDDGTETAWIETDPGAEHPAPVITLTAAEPEADHHGGGGDTTTTVADDTGGSATDHHDSDDDSSSGLAIAALVVNIVFLVVTVVGLALAPDDPTTVKVTKANAHQVANDLEKQVDDDHE